MCVRARPTAATTRHAGARIAASAVLDPRERDAIDRDPDDTRRAERRGPRQRCVSERRRLTYKTEVSDWRQGSHGVSGVWLSGVTSASRLASRSVSTVSASDTQGGNTCLFRR